MGKAPQTLRNRCATYPLRPNVSALMRNRAGAFSVERLTDILTALGQAAEITVRPTRKEHGNVSIVVWPGQPGETFHAHYGAPKGGVISFVKGLSTALAPHHILVNCVTPGWIERDMARPVLENRRLLCQAISVILLRRLDRPEEVAMPILFLASSLATHMTGEVMNINGGNDLCG